MGIETASDQTPDIDREETPDIDREDTPQIAIKDKTHKQRSVPPDKDTEQTPDIDKEETPDSEKDPKLAKNLYQTLYRRALCYSKLGMQDLCIEVLFLYTVMFSYLLLPPGL